MTIEVLVLIGEILGLTVLGVVGLAVVLLLLVLFVPIRYRIFWEKENEMLLQIKATWLLHIVSFRIRFKDFKEGFIHSVRVLGIPISKKKKKHNNKDESVISDTSSVLEAADHSNPDKDFQSDNKAITWIPEKENVSITSGPKNKLHFADKIKEKWNSVLELFQTFRDKKNFYFTILESDTFHNVWVHCKKELFRMWKSIRPRKIKGTVCFGFDDPSTTGRVLGAICMLYAFYGDTLTVIPNFEEKIFEGKLAIRGRVRMITILFIALRLYKDKDLKHLRSMLKKEEL